MRSYNTIARFVSISLMLILVLGILHLAPLVSVQADGVEITKTSHYAGNTDVYTNKKNTCIKIKRKGTGDYWIGTTDDLGRLVINTGTIVPKDELEASEAKCPEGEDQSTGSALQGLMTIAMENKRGQVKVTLPADIRAGDTISGTVDAYERDNPVAPLKAARSSDTLEGAVIDINGQQHRLRDRILTFVVPAAGAAVPMILRDRSGREIERSQIPVNQNTTSTVPSRPSADQPVVPPRPNNFPPTPLGNFQPPRIGQVGRELSIPGNFDGHAGTTNVSIGNQPAGFLAESPRSTFVKVPDNIPAQPTMLTVEEASTLPGMTETQSVSEQFKFNPVSVDLSADKLNLLRGESTTLRITLRGLELDDYEEQLMLELENLSPQVVHFAAREAEQKLSQQSHAKPKVRSEMLQKTINPSEARNGVLMMEERLTGIHAGAFTIHALLYLPRGNGKITFATFKDTRPDPGKTVHIYEGGAGKCACDGAAACKVAPDLTVTTGKNGRVTIEGAANPLKAETEYTAFVDDECKCPNKKCAAADKDCAFESKAKQAFKTDKKGGSATPVEIKK